MKVDVSMACGMSRNERRVRGKEGCKMAKHPDDAQLSAVKEGFGILHSSPVPTQGELLSSVQVLKVESPSSTSALPGFLWSVSKVIFLQQILLRSCILQEFSCDFPLCFITFLVCLRFYVDSSCVSHLRVSASIQMKVYTRS